MGAKRRPFLLAVVLPIAVVTSAGGRECDETKCRASLPIVKDADDDVDDILSRYPLLAEFEAFCWASSDETVNDSSNCADGYSPVRIDGVVASIPGREGAGHVYFTCCPSEGAANATENHCDSTLESCASWDGCMIATVYGKADAAICNDNGGFSRPNAVESRGSWTLFTCCDAEYDGSLPNTYIRGKSFYATVIMQLALSGVVWVFLSVLIGSVLLYSSVLTGRNRSYNLYIVFLALTDWIFNLGFATCYAMPLADKTTPSSLTLVLTGFSLYANLWINAIISYEVLQMALRSFRRMRTSPPTPKKVICQCLAVYIGTVALFGILLVDGSSSVYLNLIAGIFGILVLVPVVFIPYASWKVYRTGLLERMSGRARTLALFFGRIILVFFIFLVPGLGIGIYSVLQPRKINMSGWSTAVSCYLITLQGGVSGVIALTKPDIRDSFNGFMSRASFPSPSRLRLPSTVISSLAREDGDNDEAKTHPDNGAPTAEARVSGNNFNEGTASED